MTITKTRLSRIIKYISVYSSLFALIGFIIFLPFIAEGKSLIWISDGTDQHYTSLIYYSSYLRSIVKKFFLTGRFVLPMWDFKIGQGADIITTLNYYCIGDPLTLIVIFFPESKIELCYNFLILFRLYLSGVSFSAYCFYMKQSKAAVLIGALVYSFCGYALFALRHPFFLNPLIYLPLLFIGIEQILKKQRTLLFTFMVFISAVSNFYFLFMLSVLTLIYASIRYFYVEETEKNIKAFFITAAKASLHYFLGITMAAFILLPTIIVMRETSRYSESGSVLMGVYPLMYYIRIFSSFFYIPRISYWSCLGFPTTGVLAMIILFSKKAIKLRQLKTAFLIGIAFFTLPVLGLALNGFAYTSNRWIFGFAFIIALIFVTVLSDMEFEVSKLVWLAALVWAFALFVVNIYVWTRGYMPEYNPAFQLLITLCVILFAYIYREHMGGKVFKLTFILVTIISLCFNGNQLYGRSGHKVINEFSYKDEYLKNIKNSPMKLAAEIKDSSFFRVDTYRWSFYRKGERKEVSDNEAMLLRYKGIAAYFSLINSNYARYINELNIIGILSPHRIYSLDNRTTLNSLASVKYVLSSSKQHSAVPYGYKIIKQIIYKGDRVRLYKNKYFLPLGYTYTSSIKASEYKKLDLLDKQQIMLDKVVLDDTASINGSSDKAYTSKLVEIPCKRSIKKSVTKYYKPYNLKHYSIKSIPNSEVYVVLKNVKLNGASRFNVIAETKKTMKFAKFYNNAEAYYYGRKDAVINLGYYKNSITDFLLYVDTAGKLSYDQMRVICVPMRGYVKKIKELKADSLQNIRISENKITGAISVKRKKILCLSIPYSKGWKAEVDDKAVPIYKANLMYMAISIPKGNHTIKLNYFTPGLVTGSAISSAAFLIYLGLFIIPSIKGSKNRS